MAGDWIKLEHVTPDKPEVIAIADALGMSDHDLAWAKCVRLWIWLDQNSTDGNAVSVTDSFIDRFTRVTGFSKALRKVGWLDGRDGRLSVPNFERHNGKSAKTRANTSKRVQKTREKCNAPSVTKSLPEKRREEKSIKTIYTPGSDVIIPTSLRDQSVIDAVGVWIDYLSKAHPDKAIESNSPQEEALFRTIASWGARPSEIVARIDECISRSWANIRKPDQASTSALTAPASDVWGKVVNFAVSDGLAQGYTQRLSEELGVKVANAAKKVGMPAIAQANDFQLSELKKRFAAEMKG